MSGNVEKTETDPIVPTIIFPSRVKMIQLKLLKKRAAIWRQPFKFVLPIDLECELTPRGNIVEIKNLSEEEVACLRGKIDRYFSEYALAVSGLFILPLTTIYRSGDSRQSWRAFATLTCPESVRS